VVRDHRHLRTPEEWQTSVDVAAALLAIYDASHHRPVHGRPEINIGLCALLVQLANEQGIRPREDAVARYVDELHAQIQERNHAEP
jgi:hypothetical protein